MSVPTEKQLRELQLSRQRRHAFGLAALAAMHRGQARRRRLELAGGGRGQGNSHGLLD